MNQDIIVKESRVHGRGVFAARDFSSGEVVLDWNTCTKATDKTQGSNIIYYEGKYYEVLEPGKFINHSCNPNTRMKNFCDVAVREIKKGEEITSNYNEYSVGKKVPCNCGSKKCKGFFKK